MCVCVCVCVCVVYITMVLRQPAGSSKELWLYAGADRKSRDVSIGAKRRYLSTRQIVLEKGNQLQTVIEQGNQSSESIRQIKSYEENHPRQKY